MKNATMQWIGLGIVIAALALSTGAVADGATVTYDAEIAGTEHRGTVIANENGVACAGGGDAAGRQYLFECGVPV